MGASVCHSAIFSLALSMAGHHLLSSLRTIWLSERCPARSTPVFNERPYL